MTAGRQKLDACRREADTMFVSAVLPRNTNVHAISFAMECEICRRGKNSERTGEGDERCIQKDSTISNERQNPGLMLP
jgi:hypothetical protein